MVVEKGCGESKKVRICRDYKVTLNPVSRIKHYPLPNPNDIFATMKDGKIFTKIDLTNAYQQLPLTDRTQELTTINTH